MYLLCFHVPKSHLEPVKEAIFKTGAGRMGLYSHCAWQTLGRGQFKPLPGNNAFLGETNQLEYVEEYKVELVCEEDNIMEAVIALKEVHPYETPSYQVIKLERF